MTTAIAIDAFDDTDTDEPQPKPLVPRRVLDARCDHGFLAGLCGSRGCPHFSRSGAPNPRPPPLGPSSPGATSLSVSPAAPPSVVPGLESPTPKRVQPVPPERWAQLEIDLPPRGAALHYGWAISSTPTLIIATVAQAFALTSQDILGQSRFAHVALARQIAMYLSRDLCRMSFPAIGRAFGNRDHSTVMSAYRRVLTRTAHDSNLAAIVARLRFVLTSKAVAAE